MATILIALSSVSVAEGQRSAARFETASIKRSIPDAETPGCGVVVDRVGCANHSMLDYISIALGVPRYLIADAPGWVADERFDVEGKLPRGAQFGSSAFVLDHPLGPLPNFPLADLLRERTALRFHGEKRELNAYELVPFRNDGTFGPSLCRGPTDECRLRQPSSLGGSGRLGLFVSGEWRVKPNLPSMLAARLQRPVIDHTGLNGPVNLAMTAFGAGESILAALRDQLGLNLQDATVMLDVLVIDHIERPSEN